MGGSLTEVYCFSGSYDPSSLCLTVAFRVYPVFVLIYKMIFSND